MEMLFIIIGIFVGAAIGWLMAKIRLNILLQVEKETLVHQYNELEKEMVAYKTKATVQLENALENSVQKVTENNELKDRIKNLIQELHAANNHLATCNADLKASSQTITEKNKEIADLRLEVEKVKKEFNACLQQLATAKANNEALGEKLETQKNEIQELGKKFNMEFENIANKILETKTEKFTEQNKANMKDLLDPLGQNISEFKKTVAEVYDKEAKERFSLGEKVKELAQLNQVISEEARNLTNALKGEAKTQGCWGEMILESILEKSGLRKGEEYFMEHQLKDSEGNPLRLDGESKKMRPDAVIKYPDKRSVIIDSKVSLNAFTRYLDADNAETQKMELLAHVSAVKNHIITLSERGYDNYDKSLDFVMMFIPSEPAYIAAMQGDPNLWNFAYDRRILLINPTNLIISLKLIVDLWKREYQNKNAQKIAETGSSMYEKFVGFVKKLQEVGKHIDQAKDAYTDGYKQLTTGNGNLVRQATTLKNLGIKTKKTLPNEIVELALGNEEDEEILTLDEL